ncbi:hypothetical protein PF003_g9902 [Phytophthora fragariae]|nr:hypothetical protein PF003_g9902 [Phytophthora fragariae]
MERVATESGNVTFSEGLSNGYRCDQLCKFLPRLCKSACGCENPYLNIRICDGWIHYPDQDAPPPQAENAAAAQQVNPMEHNVGVPADAPTAGSAMAKPAQPSSRGSTPRRPSVRIPTDVGGPFALPRREYAGDVDVDMEDVSRSGAARDPTSDASSVGIRVQTMPTLPTPPTFRGSTAQEKQTSMKKYEAYCRQLTALETAFFCPFRMPVGACVEDERRRLIAMFDICKPLDEITEGDWINYFWE